MVAGGPAVCRSQSENLWPIVSESFYRYIIETYIISMTRLCCGGTNLKPQLALQVQVLL